MKFGWINWVNAAAVFYLLAVNIAAAKKGIAGDLKSDHFWVNAMEQIGRYGCMAFMVLPVVKEWKFGFSSAADMFFWLCATVVLLVIYSVLWLIKRQGSRAVLFGLVLVPAILFLANGCLLHHLLLFICALIFGVFHLWICAESMMEKKV